MMPIQPAWWDLIVLALLLLGFGALALANRHASAILIGRGTTHRERRTFHLTGWLAIAAALLVCVIGWRGNFGTFMWFGWVTMAALAIVLAVTYWPGRKTVQPRSARAASQAVDHDKTSSSGIAPRLWQGVLLAGLVAIPAALFWSLHDAEVHPLRRSDAVEGQVGPWTFTLVEEEPGPPEIIGKGVPAKHMMLRFCESCDGQIRAAYLKIREPRSAIGLGLRFTDVRASREVILPIPPAATAEDGIWLTVIGHDHKTWRTRLDIERVSPGLAAFLKERKP